MTKEMDFEGHAQGHNSNSLIEAVRESCKELIDLEAHKKSLDDELKSINKRIYTIKSVDIPERMAEAGCGDVFSLDTGEIIKLSQYVSGSLPKDPEGRQKAFEALEEMEAGGLIKTEVKISFGKGEDENAKEAVGILELNGFTPECEKGVHSQTLAAFAREKLRDGEDIDLSVLGLTTGQTTKVTYPKK